MGDLSLNIKRYFRFSADEVRSIIIGIIIMAFIFSFDSWGVETFDLGYGLKNFFNAILIITLSFLVHLSVQRIFALAGGFRVEYKNWLYGILIGIALIIISNGKVWFFAPGGLVVYMMAGHRLGSFRYGLNVWPVGVVGMVGPLANLVLALFFKILFTAFPENTLLYSAMSFNLWFAIFTMLPIPPLDGSKIFFASRVVYVFAFTGVIAMSAALFFLGVFLSFLIGLIVGVICWLTYTWMFERAIY